jgi:YbgC/YbaW family acyl-CoA thioester hydrolase
MFTYRSKIRLQHTDATGVLFFPVQFQFAMETLEDFFVSKGFSLKSLFSSSYFFPVVHAEADYLAPLMVGDDLDITLNVVKMGTSSVTFHYTLQNMSTGSMAGRVEVIHVLVDKEKRTSVPLPNFLKEIFTAESI